MESLQNHIETLEKLSDNLAYDLNELPKNHRAKRALEFVNAALEQLEECLEG